MQFSEVALNEVLLLRYPVEKSLAALLWDPLLSSSSQSRVSTLLLE